jgi:hypothetical protein
MSTSDLFQDFRAADLGFFNLWFPVFCAKIRACMEAQALQDAKLVIQGLVNSLDASQKETLQEIAQFAHIKSADTLHNASANRPQS